jgi:hypothetical protein
VLCTRAWLVVGPAVLAGVLASHELAYRITRAPAGPAHDYLSHAPQVVLILVALGLLATRIGTRERMPAAWQAPVVAVATFVVQEHLERLVHTGGVPWILTSPVFLVGLLLQLPVAVLAWLLARNVLETLSISARMRARRASPVLARLAPPTSRIVGAIIGVQHSGRGPPLSLCR